MSSERAMKGYTLKDIFDTKLHGEPFDLNRKTLVRDMFWLVEREIFAERQFDVNDRATYVCMYPVRIWHMHGRDRYLQTTVDHIIPGETWTF